MAHSRPGREGFEHRVGLAFFRWIPATQAVVAMPAVLVDGLAKVLQQEAAPARPQFGVVPQHIHARLLVLTTSIACCLRTFDGRSAKRSIRSYCDGVS